MRHLNDEEFYTRVLEEGAKKLVREFVDKNASELKKWGIKEKHAYGEIVNAAVAEIFKQGGYRDVEFVAQGILGYYEEDKS